MIKFDYRRTWGPHPSYPHVLNHKTKLDTGGLMVLAGPCSVESEEQMEEVCAKLRGGLITALRGGVYRAGTYPPLTKLTRRGNRMLKVDRPFGLQKNLLKMMSKVAKRHGLGIIIEVIDIRDLDFIDKYADAFQVGARQGQGYALLRELSRTKKMVTLKRGSGMKLDEFLGAAEYLAQGKCKPVLIERGGASIHNHVRWDLSISLIAAVKQMTGMPILVDASHGTGRRDLVEPMTLAGIAAGADGFLVEVHPEPEKSLSDADQAFPLDDYHGLLAKALNVKVARGTK